MSQVAPEPTESVDAPARVRFRRTRRLLGKVPFPSIKTKRGMLLAAFLVAGFGSVVTVVGVAAVSFTETASFCGLCHTMAPEMKAYQLSAHSELACAECHVAPGVGGWVKAKVAGTKQLFELITHTFPEPIPAPDHSDLPPVTETCLRCHSLASITQNGGPVKLVLRPRYEEDQKNTRDMVAVVLRPVGLNSDPTTLAGGSATQPSPRGVHWHVQQQVTYTSNDIRSQVIDSVTVRENGGAPETYISASKVSLSSNAGPDLQKLTDTEFTRTMDCLDCHNRAGHGLPSTEQSVDDAMSSGTISAQLPFIKRDAVALLNADYASIDAADTAIDGLTASYQRRYPSVAADHGADIATAITTLKSIYRELATPEMKVAAKTYPNNLGHQSSVGCFRCHDGAHFKVVNGAVTNETIPSSCSTCHTFPQVGGSVTGLLLDGEPTSHNDSLWVFNHKDAAAAIASIRTTNAKHTTTPTTVTSTVTTDPTGTACGACHQTSYCENCHSTGAIKVTHDQMLYNHAQSIRISGGKACAYCHQPVFCSSCHTGNVLDTPADKPTAITATRTTTTRTS
jgi:nitrate/TMAO reductase-like tetraheme cytochrome c subunit